MNRLKTILSKRIAVLAAISLLAMGITLPLAWKLSPWLYAINVPVKLYLQAPASTQIDVCWDKARIECLPLVPYLSNKNRMAESSEIADVWLSELPPRPAYIISIVFKSKIKNATYQSLDLDSQKTYLWGKIEGVGIQNVRIGIEQLIAYQAKESSGHLNANTGGYLINVHEIKPGPSNANERISSTIIIWGLLFSIYLFFAIPLVLLPDAIKNVGLATRNYRRSPAFPWWLYAFLGMAVIALFFITQSLPITFDSYDVVDYLKTSLSQTWLINVARPPGYYVSVAWMLWLFKNDLNGIILSQTAIFALATSVSIWALRKWLNPLVAVLVIAGILFSPSQTYWILSIMRESFFVSVVLVGIAAAISHLTATDKISSGVWLAVFSLTSGLALLIRENGILLPGVLLFALLLTMLKNLKSSRTMKEWLQSIYKPAICCFIPIFCTGVVYFGLSLYNYTHYGYFQFTRHSTSHDAMWRQITNANFDSRSLLSPDAAMQADTKTYLGSALYSSFIAEREKEPALDPIYTSLFPSIQQKMIQKGHGDSPDLLHSASIVNDIGRSANIRLPWEANLAGLMRQYREFIASNTHGYSIPRDNPAGLAAKQWLVQQSSIDTTYYGKPIPANSIIDKYDSAVLAYNWYYALFILGFLSGLYLWRYDDPVFAIPIILFMANAFLMIALRMEYFRFIECLDILLVLQVGLGLTSWMRRHLPIISKNLTGRLKENRRSNA